MDGLGWDEDLVEALVEWYLARPTRYVLYVDAPEWRAGYANGWWSFQQTAVREDFREAKAAVARNIDAAACPTLDDWLRADLKGELLYKGDVGGVQRAIAANMNKSSRNRRGERIKCPCGKRFVAQRANAVNCPACIEFYASNPHAPRRRSE